MLLGLKVNFWEIRTRQCTYTIPPRPHLLRDRAKETERDREVERQSHNATERQRKSERQRERETIRQRERERERQNCRETAIYVNKRQMTY